MWDASLQNLWETYFIASIASTGGLHYPRSLLNPNSTLRKVDRCSTTVICSHWNWSNNSKTTTLHQSCNNRLYQLICAAPQVVRCLNAVKGTRHGHVGNLFSIISKITNQSIYQLQQLLLSAQHCYNSAVMWCHFQLMLDACKPPQHSIFVTLGCCRCRDSRNL